MISTALRVILITGSVLTVAFMLQRIRVAKAQIRDTITWILFSLVLLVISIFPGIAEWASRVIGIQSPINFVYLVIIFILLLKLFSSSMRISQLDARVDTLAQKLALLEKEQQGRDAAQKPAADATKEE